MHFILKILSFSIIMRCEETKLVGVFMDLVCWFVVFSPLFSFFGAGSMSYSWGKKQTKNKRKQNKTTRSNRESNSLRVLGTKISWSLMVKPHSLTIIYYLYRGMILPRKPRSFSLMFPTSIIYVQFPFEKPYGFGTFCVVFWNLFFILIGISTLFTSSIHPSSHSWFGVEFGLILLFVLHFVRGFALVWLVVLFFSGQFKHSTKLYLISKAIVDGIFFLPIIDLISQKIWINIKVMVIFLKKLFFWKICSVTLCVCTLFHFNHVIEFKLGFTLNLLCIWM